jgi:hypothetical protein
MKYLFICYFAIVSFSAISQIANREIKWEGFRVEKIDTENKYFLFFKGASYNEDLFPIYSERFSLHSNSNSATFNLEDPVYEYFSENDLSKFKFNEKITKDISIFSSIQYERKKTLFGNIFYPYKKESVDR